MEISIIINGVGDEVKYVETKSGVVLSKKNYISKFGEDTYKLELAKAHEKRRKEQSRWI